MKYSVTVKFLAIFLCAATLLGALASGAGLVCLAELGGKSSQELYAQRVESVAVAYAEEAGEIFASQEYGGASRNLTNQHYGNDWQSMYFNWSRVGYVLRDADGEPVMEQQIAADSPVKHTLTVPVRGEYIHVLTVTPETEYGPEAATDSAEGAYHVMVAPSQETTTIGFAVVDYSDGSSMHWNTGEKVATLYDRGITLVLESYHMADLAMGDGWYPTHILLQDLAGNVVYEASAETGILLSMEQDGNLTRFQLPPGQITQQALTGVTVTEGDYTAYDAIPEQGITVAQMMVTFGDPENGDISSEGISGVDLIGTVFRNHEGNAEFRSTDPMTMDVPDGTIITHISFLDAQGNTVFDAVCPGGVGTLSYDENGYLIFRGIAPGTQVPEETISEENAPGEMASEETAPEETLPEETQTYVGSLAVLQKDVTVYNIPDLRGKEQGELAAGQEITILNQQQLEEELWLLTFDGWILAEEGLLSELLSQSREVPEEEMLPEETVQSEPVSEEDNSAEPASGEALQETVPEETILEATEPAAVDALADEEPAVTEGTLPPAEEEEVIPTEAVIPPEELVERASYYDPELKQQVVAEYVLVPVPEGYTMELQLAEGALGSEFEWTLLALAEAFRHILLEALGVCAAVFVLCLAYLCCSAGRSGKTNGVCPGGLNRLPLDLYLGLDVLLGIGLVALAAIGVQHFGRKDQELALVLLGGSAGMLCLMVVGFFFAFVAQIKTPGGYWWRNTLCGRAAKFSLVFCSRLTRLCGAAWVRGKPLCGRLLRNGKAFCIVLWQLGCSAVVWLWDTGKRLGRWLWDLVLRWWDWTGKKLVRFFGLLPITWQFLLVGFMLVFLLYVCLRSYKVGWILVGFGLFFATILYAASAFAILLENARRMSKGDLDTKVDDRMLIGGFRDFAGELNDLANVAVIAAQKQLKSERMKTELITNVSHDIKTPLTSIINYVDLLQKPHSAQEQETYLEVLSRQSLRLKKLVDDLMEMSKASTGNLAVEITRMDAAETVNQALGEFADKLERAELTPVFRQPEETVEMLADGRLVWRVMSNLLSNAVKYALPGTRVYLDLLKLDGKVIISMKNISREELNVNADELMERFVRGDASRNTEGSGLGLNIARSLMELQKGELQLLVDGDLFKVTLIFPGA